MGLFRKLSILAISMLGLTVSPVLAGSINTTPISGEMYWQLIESSRETISHLNGLPIENIKQNLEELANKWETITEVETNGIVTPMDNGYLIAMFRAEEPNLKQIDGVLGELQEAHKKQPDHVFSGVELTSLHAILARPEFIWADQAPSPLNTLLQKLLDAMGRLWNRIFGDDPINLPGDTVTLFILASIILIVILAFVFRTVLNDFVKDAQVNGEENEVNEPLTSEVAFQKAQNLSQGGDYRSAVRYLYLSSLLLMDERGVLRYDRSRTNREYLRSVANNPELSEPLGDVIEVFDNVWYGYHPVEEETFRQYSSRVEELKEKKS